MALSDYFNGPTYRRKVEELEKKLAESQGDHATLLASLRAQLSELQERAAQLQNLAEKCGAFDLLEVQEQIEREQVKLDSLRKAISRSDQELQLLNDKAVKAREDILVIEGSLLLESFALYVPKFKLNSSHEYKTRLDSVRERQKVMIKDGLAAIGSTNWEVNGSKVEGRKLVNDMLKLLIRSFNNEADYCVDNVKFDNIELGEKRLRKSYEACNKLGRVMSARLSEDYLNLKLDELHLAHEFQVKKQEEREEAKRVREELRESQKLEQEIRIAREKINKERKHFEQALHDFEQRLARTASEELRLPLLAKIEEIKAGRSVLDKEEKVIDYREQNAKAGYVYVISNIGAFGEGIYKIGMTRRLDPLERIDELGDASVPFWFDVHALVFSENAPALEAKLHLKFATGRLNKVNGRKEFFRADISEIEAIIRADFDASVEVKHEAAAEQYRESLRMSMPRPEIQQSERAAVQKA